MWQVLSSVGDKTPNFAFAGSCTLSEYFPSSLYCTVGFCTLVKCRLLPVCLIIRPHRLHDAAYCHVDFARSVVCLYVCLCVRWAHGWAVQKQLNRWICRLGDDCCGSKKPCIRWGSRSDEYIRCRKRDKTSMRGLLPNYSIHLLYTVWRIDDTHTVALIGYHRLRVSSGPTSSVVKQ